MKNSGIEWIGEIPFMWLQASDWVLELGIEESLSKVTE